MRGKLEEAMESIEFQLIFAKKARAKRITVNVGYLETLYKTIKEIQEKLSN